MNTTEDLFRDSISQYQVLIDFATSLNEKMATMSPEDILANCEELRQLHDKQVDTDKFIIDIMNDTGPEILDMPYTGEYQRLLDTAMQSCNKVATKAQTIRSLLQNEITKLKKGQQGLAGYTAANQNSQLKTKGRY